MVNIEETEQTTLVKFTQLASALNNNSVNISNTTITRKLDNFTTLRESISTSVYGGYEPGVFETIEYLDRKFKNIKIWN